MRASVVLPVYNERPQFLRQCLDSILRQTYRDFELIIADDGSTSPNTLGTIEDYAQRDSRVRLCRFDHSGLTSTLQKALGMSHGEVIFRHDSDDWSEPNRFQAQIQVLADHPNVGLVGSAVFLHQEDGKPLWISKLPVTDAAIRKVMKGGNAFCHGAVAFRAELAKKVGGYRTEFHCSQDYDFFWRLGEVSETANLPLALYHHRHTATSISINRAMDQALTSATIRARINGRDREKRDITISDTAVFRRADQLLLAGHQRAAVTEYLRRLQEHPTNSKAYLKVLRCALFVAMPPLRRAMFERKIF